MTTRMHVVLTPPGEPTTDVPLHERAVISVRRPRRDTESVLIEIDGVLDEQLRGGAS